MSSRVQRRPGRPAKALSPDSSPTHRLAVKLRKLRVDTGLNQRDLAKQIREQCPPEDQFSRGVIQRLEAGETDPIPLPHFRAHVVGCGGDLETWLVEYEEYRQEWRAQHDQALTSDLSTPHPRQAPRNRFAPVIKIIWPVAILSGILVLIPLMMLSVATGPPVAVRSFEPWSGNPSPRVTNLDLVPPSEGDLMQTDEVWAFSYSDFQKIVMDAFNGAQLALWSSRGRAPSYIECSQLANKGTSTLKIGVGDDVCVKTSEGRTAWLHMHVTASQASEQPLIEGFDITVWEPISR
jgi:hypothetical protein